MAIYSRCVNAREKLDDVLPQHFPWCKEWDEELKRLFDGYVDRKEAAGVLDYDDLLLYWHALLADAEDRATPSASCSIACWSTSIRTPTRCRPRSSTALARGQGADRRRRRRPVDLRLPRGHGAQHPRFPQALSQTRRSSRWSRTTAARSRSWRPPTA